MTIDKLIDKICYFLYKQSMHIKIKRLQNYIKNKMLYTGEFEVCYGHEHKEILIKLYCCEDQEDDLWDYFYEKIKIYETKYNNNNIEIIIFNKNEKN